MANDPLTAVQDLQGVVTALAPTIRPQVLPKGVTYGLDLFLSLCKTEEQRQTLVELVYQSQPIDGRDRTLSTTHQEDEEKTDQEGEDDGEYWEPQVIGTFDVANRVFALQKVQWMHERDAVVHELARFMELQLENPLVSQKVVQYFLHANGYAADDVMVAQRCFSAAFALQTLLRLSRLLRIRMSQRFLRRYCCWLLLLRRTRKWQRLW
uniref:Uncharacterized protein n=1 Tax=Hyaloperonospora arabidopsidis (strain Emoy2) TaxID=559515 RepID=M4C4J9_HYAAE